MVTHSSILAWRIPWTEQPESDMTEPLTVSLSQDLSVVACLNKIDYSFSGILHHSFRNGLSVLKYKGLSPIQISNWQKS